MGIYDREYYRKSLPRGGFGYFSVWSITTWLIVINILVFFADAILQRNLGHRTINIDGFDFLAPSPLYQWGYFSIDLAIRHAQVWRFLTFQFLHASPMHLIFNMIGIYFFGPIVEAHFQGRRYLAFYLLCGLAGAIFFLLLSAARVLDVDPSTPMIGASAGIFGLLVAAAMIAPDVELFYYIFPITIRTAAIFGIGLALFSVFTSGPNVGGEAAHLGGGLMGFVFMKNQHWLNPFASRGSGATAGGRRRKRRAFQKDWSKDFNR